MTKPVIRVEDEGGIEHQNMAVKRGEGGRVRVNGVNLGKKREPEARSRSRSWFKSEGSSGQEKRFRK